MCFAFEGLKSVICDLEIGTKLPSKLTFAKCAGG